MPTRATARYFQSARKGDLHPRSRVPCRDAADASLLTKLSPPVHRQLLYVCTLGQGSLASRHLCGPMYSIRRKFPNSLAAVRLQQGESAKWVNEDDIVVGRWKDKCHVFMIATNDAGGDVIRPTRRH